MSRQDLNDLDYYGFLIKLLKEGFGDGCDETFNGEDNFDRDCINCHIGYVIRHCENMIDFIIFENEDNYDQCECGLSIEDCSITPSRHCDQWDKE